MLDSIAANYVFGVHGSKHRPRGRITLNTIQDMEQCQELNTSQLLKWRQFLQVWLDAGWGTFDVTVMVDELRPLIWGRPQSQEFIATTTAKQMAVYSARYSSCQGHRHAKLQEALTDFICIVQKHFSNPTTVLLPAEDVSARLSNVVVS